MGRGCALFKCDSVWELYRQELHLPRCVTWTWTCHFALSSFSDLITPSFYKPSPSVVHVGPSGSLASSPVGLRALVSLSAVVCLHTAPGADISPIFAFITLDWNGPIRSSLPTGSWPSSGQGCLLSYQKAYCLQSPQCIFVKWAHVGAKGGMGECMQTIVPCSVYPMASLLGPKTKLLGMFDVGSRGTWQHGCLT